MLRTAVVAFLLLALPAAAHAGNRLAFVVGIDQYDNLGPQQQLQRAVSDARAVKGALLSLGFKVLASENVGRSAFNAQWQKFLDSLQPDDVAVIYFSGHGVEIEGLNFLLPRDVPIISYGRQEQLKRESLSVSEMLLDLRRRKPQVTLVILDACRENPLIPPEERSLSWGRGLVKVDAPSGTFIMSSARVGETALDRLPGNDPDKENSIFTRKLLSLMRTPNLPLHEMARHLRREVHDLAATVTHVQQPAYYDGLIGRFCLAGCEEGTDATGGAVLKVETLRPAAIQYDFEMKSDVNAATCTILLQMINLPVPEFVNFRYIWMKRGNQILLGFSVDVGDFIFRDGQPAGINPARIQSAEFTASGFSSAGRMNSSQMSAGLLVVTNNPTDHGRFPASILDRPLQRLLHSVW